MNYLSLGLSASPVGSLTLWVQPSLQGHLLITRDSNILTCLNTNNLILSIIENISGNTNINNVLIRNFPLKNTTILDLHLPNSLAVLQLIKGYLRIVKVLSLLHLIRSFVLLLLVELIIDHVDDHLQNLIGDHPDKLFV